MGAAWIVLRRVASAAVVALAGCAGSPPGPVAAKPPGTPVVLQPPWQTHLSIAEGYEAREVAARPVVVRNATLLLGNGASIVRGTIVLQGGKITAVGAEDAAVPTGADVVDANGKFVTPGIIDTHSHLGVLPSLDVNSMREGNEVTDPVMPQAQTADAFWTQDPSLARALAGGVTTIQVLPGSGNLIGGRAITIKLKPGHSTRELHVPGAPDGLKMACGENPKRVYGKKQHTPMTRMGNVALQRAAFLKAKKLREAWARYRESESKRLYADAKKRATYDAQKEERSKRDAWCKGNGEPSACAALRKDWAEQPLDEPVPTDPVVPPERDPGTETLVAALEGSVLVHVHCYRADDMMAMIALGEEVGFSIRSFHHAVEAYKIRDRLTARGIGVSTWADWWGFKLEAFDAIPENAALVAEAKGRAIIHSDSEEGIQRLNQEAGKALASGLRAGLALTVDDAMTWITKNPAWALGIDQRTGTLEVGKDADVVLWDRHPLSVYARAEKVWIDGGLVFERAKTGGSDFELGQEGETQRGEKGKLP